MTIATQLLIAELQRFAVGFKVCPELVGVSEDLGPTQMPTRCTGALRNFDASMVESVDSKNSVGTPEILN